MFTVFFLNNSNSKLGIRLFLDPRRPGEPEMSKRVENVVDPAEQLQKDMNYLKVLLNWYIHHVNHRGNIVNLQYRITKLEQTIAAIEQAMQEKPEIVAPDNLEEARHLIIEAYTGLWYLKLKHDINAVKIWLDWRKDEKNQRSLVYNKYLQYRIAELEQTIAATERAMQEKPEIVAPDNLEEAKALIAEARQILEAQGQ